MTRSSVVHAAFALLALPCCDSNRSASPRFTAGSGGMDAAGRSSSGGETSAGGRAASGGAAAAMTTSAGGSTGGAANVSGGTSSTGGRSAGAGGTSVGAGGDPASGGMGGASPGPSYADVKQQIDAYKAAHPGNGGKDWDINAKTPAQIASDPAAAALLSLCGKGRRPVIPALAWEYGGGDHSWIGPDASALVYCVYIPANPGTDHWNYDAAMDHVTADLYVLYPDQNPCKTRPGADQVLSCLGDPTNIEILVDTASLNDGQDVGLDVSTASTELRLIEPDGTRIHLADNA